MFSNLLRSVLKVSEKAANIARICRENEHLFSLLVEQKTTDDANPRFVADFKTLADVLIQETVKHDIGKLFPSLRDKIHGEENSSFSNSLGETINVEIFDDVQATADRLSIVLCGDTMAAQILAAEVHKTLEDCDDFEVPELHGDVSNLGIVIDPIDATQEYISGGHVDSSFVNIPASGLQCVTVLIGVYDATSGIPVMGVVNQPFHTQIGETYKSKIHWGVSIGDTRLTNIPPAKPNKKKIAILSTSESQEIVKFLTENEYDIAYSAGAGHKILRVINGDADLYVLSKGTTFKWDTCAPHAILSALGYNLVNLRKTMDSQSAVEISYRSDEGKCNSGGVAAYSKGDQLKLLLALKEVF